MENEDDDVDAVLRNLREIEIEEEDDEVESVHMDIDDDDDVEGAESIQEGEEEDSDARRQRAWRWRRDHPDHNVVRPFGNVQERVDRVGGRRRRDGDTGLRAEV